MNRFFHDNLWAIVVWLLSLSFFAGTLWAKVDDYQDHRRLIFARLSEISERLARIEGRLEHPNP